jgi:hypothetical protein
MKKKPILDEITFEGKCIGLRNIDSQLYRKFRTKCLELKLGNNRGFEQAIKAWLALTGDDLLTQAPLNTINPNVLAEFRRRCEQEKLDVTTGIAKAMVNWIRNFAFTDPIPKEIKKPGRKPRAP